MSRLPAISENLRFAADMLGVLGSAFCEVLWWACKGIVHAVTSRLR